MKKVYTFIPLLFRGSFLFAFFCFISVANAQTVSLLAGNALGNSGMANGTGSAASFSNPFGVVADGAGNLYVADAINNQIRKIVISTKVVTLLAGNAGGASGSTNATGSAASFNGPLGLAMDGSGNLYVADNRNHEIRKIVVATGVVTTFAGAITSGNVNAVGTVARFFNPHGITYDGAGNLYVADYNNNEIRKIVISTATVSTLAGSVATGGTNTDAVGAAAGFNNPYGLAYDWNGNLFVADNNNNNIRKVVIATATVSTFAGSTFMNAGFTNAIGTAALFNSPTQVAINGNGNIYVADQANDVIRQIVISTASVTNFAGTAGTTGTTNGPVASALFNFPGGICLDYLGNIFIGDCSNNEIREISTVPLPIQLEYFTAENIGKQNVLKWVTATETNNKYFTIERCNDEISFEPLLDVKGAGNSTTPLTYEAYDEAPYKGINYYRLKQTDFDGNYSYSNIVPVFISSEKDLTIFPNPVSANINLAYNSSVAGTASIKVIDITGKVVGLYKENLVMGNNNLQIDAANLIPGLYILEADFANGNNFYKKFIKQ